METGKKGEEEWIEHMEKLYHKDTTGWKNEQWSAWGKKCLEIQKRINSNKSGWPAWNTCNVGKTLSKVHFQLKEEEREEKKKEMIKTLSNFFALSGGSKKSRKSRKSKQSQKVKSRASKSRKKTKSRLSRKQSKKLKREIELSKEMSKRISRKTPMIASSQGIKLLKRSKRNMSKGRPLASARDFLLATSILTAALSPYDPHPLAQKSKIAPDTQVHLDWHKGQFPDKKLTSKQHKTLIKRSKRGKRLATIKEGGGWSLKYKRSIDCKNPKGFSQKQYCKRILKKKRTKKNRKKSTRRRRKKGGTFSFKKNETIAALKKFTIQRLNLLSNMKDAGREKNLPVKEYIHSLIQTIYLEEGFKNLNENESIDEIFNTLLKEIVKVKGRKGSDLDTYIATSYEDKKNELIEQETALVNKTKKQWENMERIRELLEKYTPEIRNNTKWTPKHQEAYKEVVKKTREEEDNFSAIFFKKDGKQHITKTFAECAFFFMMTDDAIVSILVGGRRKRTKRTRRK